MSDAQTIIANRALSKLGCARITDFTDDSKNGRAVNNAFAPVRDGLLRRYNWSFALTRVALSADASTPAFGFAFQYPLPSDCLRLVQVGDYALQNELSDYRDQDDAPFVVEGAMILTDEPAPLHIRYVRQVTAGFDAEFSEALACLLAVEMAEELTQSSTKKEAAMLAFKDALATAARTNSIEKAPDGLVDDSWVLGRL